MAKLTQTEIIELKDKGYSASDLREINNAIKKTTYTLLLDKADRKEINELEALKLLGREEWLKGIVRSAFHIETIRTGLNGERIRIFSKTFAR